jgi:hypothetical protein
MECVGRKGLVALPGKHEAYHTLKNRRKDMACTFRYALVCTQAFCTLPIATRKDYSQIKTGQTVTKKTDVLGLGPLKGVLLFF